MPRAKKSKACKLHPTSEAGAFLDGLRKEFLEQAHKYHELTRHLFELEARVELAEKQLCLTRDHMLSVIARTEGAAPQDWDDLLGQVRFAGVRLADACMAVMRERKKVTSNELLNALNLGMYRFRTNTPLREIHGALLRQPNVKRLEDGTLLWTGPDKDKDQMPLRLVRRPGATAPAIVGGEKKAP